MYLLIYHLSYIFFIFVPSFYFLSTSYIFSLCVSIVLFFQLCPHLLFFPFSVPSFLNLFLFLFQFSFPFSNPLYSSFVFYLHASVFNFFLFSDLFLFFFFPLLFFFASYFLLSFVFSCSAPLPCSSSKLVPP
jgi:hypothetical protein